MSTRVCSVLALMVALSSLLACAAAGQSLAPYPGSKLTFEMNLTDKDFLPAIKQFLPAVPGIAREHLQGAGGDEGEMLASIDLDQLSKDLSDALAGLKRVSVAGYQLESADAEKLLQFYAGRLNLNDGWMPTLKVNQPQGAVRFYTKPDLAGMFGLLVQPDSYFIVSTDGRIDIAKLTEIAARIAPMAMTVRHSTTQQCDPPAEEQSAPCESDASGNAEPQADTAQPADK